MIRKKPIIFCDFDGTFTSKDVGNRIFTHFSGGKNTKLVEDWKKGMMTSRECLTAEAALTTVTPEEFYSFLVNFTLRDGAIELYKMCRFQNVPFIIVSDGLDLYIDFILKKFSLNEIRLFSNHGLLSGGALKIQFPYDNDGCPRCGSCKGNRIREVVGRERSDIEVIFIGDGLSDICALPEADIIFARGDLLEYCRHNDFAAIEYQDFFDILNWLKDSGRFAG